MRERLAIVWAPLSRPSSMETPRPPTTDDHWALNTTIRCQHRCVYCFEGERRGRRDQALSESLGLIAKAAAAHASYVIFMGAEPTLNPNLPELIAAARARGMRAAISTNALRLANPGYLEALRRAGLTNVELSFHYPDASVYERITRAKPKGFEQLLTALKNLERLNSAALESAGLVSELPVNVNLVVAAFNYTRLPEVIEHVRQHLGRTKYVISFKRVLKRRDHVEEEFQRDIHVPFRLARRAINDALERYGTSVKMVVRDFPLCTAPRWTELDADLHYWLRGVRVAHNFLGQNRMVDMYAPDRLKQRHPYAWLCDLCSIEPLCINRSIFNHVCQTSDNSPVPVREDIPPGLLAAARRSANGAAALDAARATAERPETELLRLLWDRVEPGRPLPGSDVLWEPLTTGVLRLQRGLEILVVRVGARHSRPFWTAGSWAAAPLRAVRANAGSPPSLLEPLLALLSTLPASTARAAVAGASGSSATDSSAAESNPRQVVRQKALFESGHRWDAFIREVFVPRLWEMIPAGASVEVHGPFADGVVFRNVSDGTTAACALSPVTKQLVPGFLCGGVRLDPDAELLRWGVDALEYTARLVLALRADQRWPDGGAGSPFVAEVFRVFGSSLWPGRGHAGAPADGDVSLGEVQLHFKLPTRARLDVMLQPWQAGQRYYADDGTIGCRYAIDDGATPTSEQLRILNGYVGKLLASARRREAGAGSARGR